MTLRIIEIARGLGIEVHDHIIVGRDGHARDPTSWALTRLKDELGKIKLDPAFIDITSGGGKNSPAR